MAQRWIKGQYKLIVKMFPFFCVKEEHFMEYEVT